MGDEEFKDRKLALERELKVIEKQLTGMDGEILKTNNDAPITAKRVAPEENGLDITKTAAFSAAIPTLFRGLQEISGDIRQASLAPSPRTSDN